MKRIKKMDPYLISRQKWELEYVRKKMLAEGIRVYSNVTVLHAIKIVGRSRQKVYNYLRKNY